jgi:hypothetical protein
MIENAQLRLDGVRHFEEARRQARWRELAARLSGRDSRLLPFDEVRARLRQQSPLYRGIQQVELEQIVGSVGRYREFNRAFLPLNNSLRERWVAIETLAQTQGWPPVELYKVGAAFFVKDGNHRVSVARQMGNRLIEAHVYEYPTETDISADQSLDEVLIRLGEQSFLERTGLSELCPSHGIRFTIPGQYSELLAQIDDLREKLTLIDGEAMSYGDAVLAWLEMVYLPTIQIIHDSGLLADMAGRTESDLFVWLSRHRDQLGALYGEYDLQQFAEALAEQYRPGSLGKVARQVKRLLGRDEAPPLNGV